MLHPAGTPESPVSQPKQSLPRSLLPVAAEVWWCLLRPEHLMFHPQTLDLLPSIRVQLEPKMSPAPTVRQTSLLFGRTTQPLFNETVDVYFTADPDWDSLDWNYDIQGAHTDQGSVGSTPDQSFCRPPRARSSSSRHIYGQQRQTPLVQVTRRALILRSLAKVPSGKSWIPKMCRHHQSNAANESTP